MFRPRSSLKEDLKDPNIKSIELSGNCSRELTEVIDNLGLNTGIEKLTLDDSSIDSHDVKLLADALKTNRTLTALYINIRGYDRIGSLFHSHSGHIADTGAEALAEVLRQNPVLKELSLSGETGITSKGAILLMEALSQNTQITSFALNCAAGHNINDIVAPLKKNNTLIDLWMTFSESLTADNMSNIVSALKLNTSHSTLESLALRFNKIDDISILPLAEALKANKSLRKLDLRRNDIGDAGAKALLHALQSNNTLVKLDLDHCNITNMEIKEKIDALLKRNRPAHEGLTEELPSPRRHYYL